MLGKKKLYSAQKTNVYADYKDEESYRKAQYDCLRIEFRHCCLHNTFTISRVHLYANTVISGYVHRVTLVFVYYYYIKFHDGATNDKPERKNYVFGIVVRTTREMYAAVRA